MRWCLVKQRDNFAFTFVILENLLRLVKVELLWGRAWCGYEVPGINLLLHLEGAV
jgi:hypothetical protein